MQTELDATKRELEGALAALREAAESADAISKGKMDSLQRDIADLQREHAALGTNLSNKSEVSAGALDAALHSIEDKMEALKACAYI